MTTAPLPPPGDESIFAQIVPFRAIRYNTAHPDVDLGTLVAPPGEGAMAGNRNGPGLPPYHALQLFPPGGSKSAPAGLDPTEKTRLRTAFEEWWHDGVLVRDETPSLYLHRLTFEAEDGSRLTRRGFFAMLALSRSGQIKVLPHENTLPGRLTRQIQIFDAIGAQVLPIFLIYSDPTDSVLQRLEDCAVEEDVLGEFSDVLGQTHRLQRVGGAEISHWLQAQFKQREVVIADGHHRFDSLRAFWNARGMAEADAMGLPPIPDCEAYVAVYLTSADAPGFRIGAIHRVLRHLPAGYPAFLQALTPLFGRKRIALETHHPAQRILEHLAMAGSGVFGFYAHGEAGWDLIYPRRDVPHPALDGIPAALRDLDVTHLHHELLPLVDPDPAKLGLEYEKDASKALAEVMDGRYAMTCFLNPVGPENIWSVARDGLTMPPKATYFFPKISAGLVSIPLAPLP